MTDEAKATELAKRKAGLLGMLAGFVLAFALFEAQLLALCLAMFFRGGR